MTNNPIYCAIDTSNIKNAVNLVDQISPFVGGIKIGLEFFTSCGINGIEKISEFKLPLFIDLKLYDIPNTVKKALENILYLKPEYTTLHISGGAEMLKECKEIKKQLNSPTKLLGVTMLTSFDDISISDIGINYSVSENVKRLTKMAHECDLDGVVCSPLEITDIKKNYGEKLKIVVPGIRNDFINSDDQKRTLSAKQAITAGADIIVVGRPITSADSPAKAAQFFQQSIK